MSRPDGDAAVLDAPVGPDVLEVDDLTVTFHRRGQRVRAVDSMSYSVAAGRTLAIVGVLRLSSSHCCNGNSIPRRRAMAGK